MALDTTTFLMIFAAALVLMGLVVWLKFRFENLRALRIKPPEEAV